MTHLQMTYCVVHSTPDTTTDTFCYLFYSTGPNKCDSPFVNDLSPSTSPAIMSVLFLFLILYPFNVRPDAF